MKPLKSIVLNLLFISLLAFPVQGQVMNDIQFEICPESELWFDGTSTIHDYTVKADEIKGNLTLNTSPLNVVSTEMNTELNNDFYNMKLSIPVKKLRSDKDKLNNKMYEALKAEKFRKITFELTNINLVDSTISTTGTTVANVTNKNILLNATGKLSVAGTEKTIKMDVNGRLTEDGMIQVKGNKSLLMSDFGIKPPTFFWGVLKTNDKVVVHYDIVFAQEIKPQTECLAN